MAGVADAAEDTVNCAGGVRGLEVVYEQADDLVGLAAHSPACGVGDVVELLRYFAYPLSGFGIDIRVIVQSLGYRRDGDPGLFCHVPNRGPVHTLSPQL